MSSEQLFRFALSGKTRPFANTLGDIFVSDKLLTNIVVLDNASIFLSGCLKLNRVIARLAERQGVAIQFCHRQNTTPKAL
ncbi:MAG: hypothetical protein II131_05365 [Neisseriaceae bacterium]|nr:hypothetical protein [Neisseriaceae bacterium]